MLGGIPRFCNVGKATIVQSEAERAIDTGTVKVQTNRVATPSNFKLKSLGPAMILQQERRRPQNRMPCAIRVDLGQPKAADF